ncbi:zinc metalloproteinase nas-15-like [Paramacrobiotus metropolitanus]|uniref:zinc metalloproteinase nas-15-like n=1 Tax=Paramacrobiotus metropolitanus TaxID=2943436 RepID=UPI0024463939|nr:zinc metalloproteinase nas-15-like [Paramacrobiotus metropolitanus]
MVRGRISCIIFFANVLWQDVVGYVVSTDTRYSKWPGNTVPYIIAPGYSEAEINTIRMAAAQIQADMGNCIRFTDLGAGPIPAATSFVIISPTGGPGVPSPTCYSFPGRVLPLSNPPTTYGQHMAIMNGPNGCLSSVRQVMRFFCDLLGLRSEHNKPGRDLFLQLNTQLIHPAAVQIGAFTEYDPRLIQFNATDFDYNSITMIEPTNYSVRGGLPVISARNGRTIYNAGRLSFRDCQALSAVYNCMIQCPTFY